MRNDDLIQRLKSQLYQCAGFDGDEIADARQTAINYYYQRPNGTEVKGRATVVSGDVSAVVEATLASMMEAFGTDAIVDFDADSPEDEEQCQLEAATVEHFVMKTNAGRYQLAQAIKDALLLRNGWIKVWIEEDRRVEIEEFNGVEALAVPDVIDEKGADESEILRYDEADGYLKLRFVYITRRFRAEAVAPELIFYPKDYDGCDFRSIQDIPFIAERHVEPRYELIRRGFPRSKVESLKTSRGAHSTVSDARNPGQVSDPAKGVDTMSEPVEWYECYAMVDGERQKVCFSDNEVLERGFVPVVPYAAGVALVAPHRLTGISLWDKIRQTQDVNTALQRALLDNAAATSKNRLAYLDGKVNTDDIADGRVNGAIRVKANVSRVGDAVMPFGVPDTSIGIQAAIQHQRGIRTELAGASLDLQSAEMQLNRQVGSQGVDRMYSAAEALAAHMTSNIAQTLIRSTFLLAHATLRESWPQEVPIKRNGNWQTATPLEWPVRERLTVKVGMSPGERSRRLASLDKLLQSQISLAEMGLDQVLVSLPQFHALLLDWARVAEVPSPERYFIDPRSDESKAAAAEKEKAATETREQQQKLVEQAVELEKLKTAFDKYKADADLQFKYYDAVLKAEIEEAKLAGSATVEMLKTKGAANGRIAPQSREEPQG